MNTDNSDEAYEAERQEMEEYEDDQFLEYQNSYYDDFDER